MEDGIGAVERWGTGAPKSIIGCVESKKGPLIGRRPLPATVRLATIIRQIASATAQRGRSQSLYSSGTTKRSGERELWLAKERLGLLESLRQANLMEAM